MSSFNLEDFRQDGSSKFSISKAKTKIKDIYDDKEEYQEMLESSIKELDELQNMMYAHNRYGFLIIFQALDAAGKDGTIRHVLSGVNPAGIKVHSFKRPSSIELEHDYLWRTSKELPERGTIAIFNRSYYEEVLVVKVHPDILQNSQLLPRELSKSPKETIND